MKHASAHLHNHAPLTDSRSVQWYVYVCKKELVLITPSGTSHGLIVPLVLFGDLI